MQRAWMIDRNTTMPKYNIEMLCKYYAEQLIINICTRENFNSKNENVFSADLGCFFYIFVLYILFIKY